MCCATRAATLVAHAPPDEAPTAADEAPLAAGAPAAAAPVVLELDEHATRTVAAHTPAARALTALQWVTDRVPVPCLGIPAASPYLPQSCANLAWYPVKGELEA